MKATSALILTAAALTGLGIFTIRPAPTPPPAAPPTDPRPAPLHTGCSGGACKTCDVPFSERSLAVPQRSSATRPATPPPIHQTPLDRPASDLRSGQPVEIALGPTVRHTGTLIDIRHDAHQTSFALHLTDPPGRLSYRQTVGETRVNVFRDGSSRVQRFIQRPGESAIWSSPLKVDSS